MCGYGKPGDWWRTSKSISGGILYDWGVHLLEYALQLIDSEMVEVAGYAKTGFWAKETKWKDDTNEDEAIAIYEQCLIELPDPIAWRKQARITIQQIAWRDGLKETQDDWSCATFWYEPVPSAKLPALPDVKARTADIWKD